jgi:hypothetical protein
MSAAPSGSPFARSISAVRESLLRLHKALIDQARDSRQQQIGRPIPPGELLQLLTSDPAFDWLHPFSQLIVAIDELLEREAPPTDRDAAAVRLEAERIVDRGGQTFLDAVARGPIVAAERDRLHAAMRELPGSDPAEHEALLQQRSTWVAKRRRPNAN